MREDRVYLQHIAECIRRIEEHTGKGREEFLQSHTLQDAVLRNLQTLSEATQRLSDDTKAKYPQIEWSRIAAFRNVLVHNYLGIDLEIVWGITQREVPELKTAISAMLNEVV
ncbi:MAG TPA: DUF86 domain-containing protein [Blastocatellia bacterium]|nr:DUF86 domain-containing protein [Blastocatellia bacterium]